MRKGIHDMSTRRKPILCVDFDGVIHSYTSGWKGAAVIPDPPVKGALRWLWKATEWFNVQIYSSRSKDPEARRAMGRWMLEHSRTEFGAEHPMTMADDDGDVGPVYPIGIAHEKPAAFLTIDDRAICFEGDWSEIEPSELLDFKPWNKRDFGATGTFPQGHLNDDDQGALKLGIAYDKLDGIVRIEFGKPVAWLGLPPPQAIEFAKLLLKNAGAKKVEIEI
jgi:hypothetical protein